jgi:hypothetical protein
LIRNLGFLKVVLLAQQCKYSSDEENGPQNPKVVKRGPITKEPSDSNTREPIFSRGAFASSHYNEL